MNRWEVRTAAETIGVYHYRFMARWHAKAFDRTARRSGYTVRATVVRVTGIV